MHYHLSEDEIIKMGLFVNLVVEMRYFHMNMNGIAFHVDST